MATPAWRVKTGLDEVRILILADQILLGFETRAVFEPGFTRLSVGAQHALLGSLGLQTLIVALTLFPTVRHRIVDRGHPTPALERATRQVAAVVLALLAMAVTVDFSIAAQRIVSTHTAWSIGLGLGGFALVAWFGVEWLARGFLEPLPQEEAMKPSPIDERVAQVLTECRIALPGAQALLGFQLVTVLLDSFEKLPAVAKLGHLGSTVLVGLATILIIAPAAFHRLVERGAPTERFERVASGLLLAALVPLGTGLAGELGVVFYVATRSAALALWAAGLSLAAFTVVWFVVPALLRHERSPVARPRLRRMDLVRD
jgi:hypothetical protein